VQQKTNTLQTTFTTFVDFGILDQVTNKNFKKANETYYKENFLETFRDFENVCDVNKLKFDQKSLHASVQGVYKSKWRAVSVLLKCL